MNKTHILTIDSVQYTLSPMQIVNLATEFYGRDMTPAGEGTSQKIDVGFEGDNGPANAALFGATITGFARKQE